MIIEHGPPGARGVTQLAYMGDDYSNSTIAGGVQRLSRPIAAVSTGIWGYALVCGDRKLRRKAGAVAVGAFLVSFVLR